MSLGSWLDFGANVLGNLLGFGSNSNTNTSNSQDVAATNAANMKIAQQTNAMNAQINEANIALQREQNEINRMREDNAVQRRAADLTRAGLSKTLAAGSAASANAMQAPQATIAAEQPHPMQPNKRIPYKFDLESNFETAEFHKNQVDVANKELEVKRQQLELEADKLEETKTHNRITEEAERNALEENKRYHDLQDEWKRLELDQNSVFHDDAMKIQRAELTLKRLSFLSDAQYKQYQNNYLAAQTNLVKQTTKQNALRLTSDLALASAQTVKALADADLSKKQIEYFNSEIRYVSELTAETMAQRFKLHSDAKFTLVSSLEKMYNLSVASSQKTKTNDITVSESVAAQNSYQRKHDIGKVVLSGVTHVFSVGVAAFLGAGGARFILNKAFGDDSHHPMGFRK